MLDLIGQLATFETRAAVAHQLAQALGADDLVLFLRDRELGVLMPAPGFVQTIPRAADWRPFLAACIAHGTHTGRMPSPRGGAEVEAVGHCVSGDTVLVLLGGSPREDAVAELLPLMPLLERVGTCESDLRSLEARASMADSAISKGVVLAQSLERSRDQLRNALATANQARRLVDEQAEELATSAEELEQSKEELEVINEELMATNEELQTTAEEAERARVSAEEANRAKAGFLAMMSHELRTPLNAIGGYASLLEEGIMGPLVPGQLEYLARIKRSQSHLLALINDVLNFAKAESGTITYNLGPVKLMQILGSVAPLIEPMAGAKGVAFDFTPSATELEVVADRDKVAQVVLNLLTNAVKFTPPEGRVRLFVEATEETAIVSVSDSGPGIPAEQCASIFEPFVQLERSYAGEREGVGLGLSISRELARGMGGDIVVNSTLGHGSTFTFSIPCVARERVALAGAKLHVPPPH